MSRRTGIRAWLISWNWMGEHAAVADPLIAVMRPQTGVSTIMKFVETLYAARSYAPSELVMWTAHPQENPYRAYLGAVKTKSGQTVSWAGQVFCGHNPFIYARRVQNLRAESGEDGTERLVWDEIVKPTPDL